MWEIALVLFLFLFFYPYLIYPGLLYVAARLPHKPPHKKDRPPDESGACPPVAMVICALNEERVIGQKVENCLALQYPGKKLRIIVVSDGSTDRTAEVVRQYLNTTSLLFEGQPLLNSRGSVTSALSRDLDGADAQSLAMPCFASGIELIEQNQRRGKIANLNQVLPRLKEEIVVLSDANVMYRPDAVMKLVARFQDPSVGCVSGKVILTDSTPELDSPTGQYYSLEWFLQERSSAIHSMVGADGAMYALRRDLFRFCPADTIIEDFVIPMGIIRQGQRVVYESAAVGWEKGPATMREEFRRKVRIAAGVAQGLIRGNAWPPVDAPLRFWFIFVSHKLLRWISPLAGLGILCCALFAMHQPAAQMVLAAMGTVVGLALVQLLTRWGNPVVSAPFYFLFGQVALGWGLLKGFMGQQTVLWAKENR
jgi:cellulose synthase/poly-beta-1,6-N-acetylglucosamine synthase-like glycosyltransferase